MYDFLVSKDSRIRSSKPHRRKNLSGAASRIALTAMVVLAANAGAMSPQPKGTCDFNGDGYADTAFGVPGESIGGVADVGAINVLYGSPFGLSANGDQLWHQNSSGVEGSNSVGDLFGSALACGNFDNDGYDDLAIGVPGKTVGSRVNAGAVNVMYGSGAGLSTRNDQVWTQNSAGILDQSDSLERFGSVLEAGDFNGDGRDDLAIGVMAESLVNGGGETLKSAGAVNIIYGSSSGLTSTDNQFWFQDSPGVIGVGESRDLFGAALASGDFDNDGFEDLAIGAPTEHEGSIKDSGAVNVLYGTSSGLSATGDQIWTQNSVGVLGVAEANDRLGASLVAADFDGDGFADLAIGAPGEAVGSLDDAGSVNVLYGGNSGLTATGDQIWYQDSPGILGGSEAYDRFAESLSAGDFNNDGRADLVIGVPWDSIGGVPEVGGVHVIYGTASGLDDVGNEWWHQDSVGVLDSNDSHQRFGSTLATGDYNGDLHTDLSIGVPGETVSGVVDAGAVNVIYGSNFGGLDSGGDEFWHQNQAGILDGAESFDRLTGAAKSDGMYRIPYANGTQVEVTGDYLTHTPQFRIDMHGEGGGPYTIAAAASGTIEAIVDTNAEPTDNNNYVWISHSNGEWTKYSHVATNSVTNLGWQVGDSISAGQAIGTESDVGLAGGDHLHFEVGVPWDLADPFQASGGFLKGENRNPVICNIPGEVFLTSGLYTAATCL